MKHFYSCLLYLAALGPAAAQSLELPPPSPLPTSFRGGSYQPADIDDWQVAKLRYTAAPAELLVQDAEHKADYPLVLAPGQLRAFALGRDTFDVVRNVTLPQAAPVPAAFARRLFRGGGFLVAEYAVYPPKPAPPIGYRLLLDRPGGRVVAVLPPTPNLFRLALAAAVRDYQPLSQQLELDPHVLPVQLPELLAAYGRWKKTQPTGTTSK